MTPMIAMITDFGLIDPFVGIMKGVIRSIGSRSDIVDITHNIKQGDIKAASFALHMAYDYLPSGTIFLAVVDPTVGTSRRPIVVEADSKMIVCPDNGIITNVVYKYPSYKAFQINREDCFLDHISSTFHGRDIFAPTAARLSMGVCIDEIGPEIHDAEILDTPEVIIGDYLIEGEVVYIDGYGNLITNISRESIENWRGDVGVDKLRVHTGAIDITGIHTAYANAKGNEFVALFGSMGTLEIAINGGSAAQVVGNEIGTKVLVYK